MKRQKRFVSVLLVLLMLVSANSAALTASAEDESVCTICVYVGNGSGRLSANGQSSKEMLLFELPIGGSVTVEAEASAGYDLLYWVSTETNRIVSFNTSCTISASHDQEFEVTFDREPEIAAAPPYNSHRVVYLSTGNNIIYSSSVPLGSTDYINHISPSLVYVAGKEWARWDHSVEEVAASTDRVFVYPIYNTNTKAFTVTRIVGNEITRTPVSYDASGKPGTYIIQAPSTLDDKPFSYWIVPADQELRPGSQDEIASVLRNYSFTVEMDVTLQAVYGAATVPPYTTRVAGDLPDFDNDSVLIRTEYSVSLNYTVVGSGVLFSRTPIGSEEEFVLSNPDVHVGTSLYTYQTGNLSFNITNWKADDPMSSGQYFPLLYVRSWLRVKDGSGNIITAYGDIYCVDYINKDYIGPEWDNYDDPLP